MVLLFLLAFLAFKILLKCWSLRRGVTVHYWSQWCYTNSDYCLCPWYSFPRLPLVPFPTDSCQELSFTWHLQCCPKSLMPSLIQIPVPVAGMVFYKRVTLHLAGFKMLFKIACHQWKQFYLLLSTVIPAEGLVLAKNSHELGLILPTLGRANVLFETDLYCFSHACSVKIFFLNQPHNLSMKRREKRSEKNWGETEKNKSEPHPGKQIT